MTDATLPELDPNNPTPLYHQIYLHYRHRILSGVLKNGERLPSEEDIATAFSVSRITAKRAMNELAEEGLVTRNRGRGTTVSYVAPERPRGDGFSGLLENLVNIAATTTVDVLTLTYAAAPSPVAELLELPVGALVQRAERRRSRDGEPFSYITSYLPEAIGRNFGEGELAAHPILQLIEQSGHEISSALQTISAEPADPIVAQALKLPPGAPLLKISRLVRDADGKPIQFIEVLYRPDMYQLEMSLSRGEDDDGRKVWSSSR
ncbi:UTRA domain-containing protein [Rhodobacteraceae bacterium 2CG4]|uniref:UTRA domain-containing protein n=1 Tax=Halovulum marinum TaxID=2662447 RepID=A0A6L5Z486_9RHOB|nr:GntR family transcriptional regulator [Halovulum marinum]MSU90905.1 UTRA domain-containing protein [Halovulum marinum]